MIDIRLASKKEIPELKTLWKLCFGDQDSYIDFYFSHKFQEDETLIMLNGEKIVSMLTIMPIKIILPNTRSFNSAMLYGIGTHPDYRGQGFSSKLIISSEKHLAIKNTAFSILVPADNSLFNFYSQQGFEKRFFLRETLLSLDKIKDLRSEGTYKISISPLSPADFKKRRFSILESQLFTDYPFGQVEYQKKLSLQSGTDLYGLVCSNLEEKTEEIKGCALVERRDENRVVIKELLLPKENFYIPALKKLTEVLKAREFLIRTPVHLGKSLGGMIRPFGMIKALAGYNLDMLNSEQGYLGIAFD